LMEAACIEQRVIRERNEDGSGRSVSALTFHSLRHSFSSLLANAGIAEETRMALTGHTTRAMQQHYTHRELSTLRDAVAVLPRVGRKSNANSWHCVAMMPVIRPISLLSICVEPSPGIRPIQSTKKTLPQH